MGVLRAPRTSRPRWLISGLHRAAPILSIRPCEQNHRRRMCPSAPSVDRLPGFASPRCLVLQSRGTAARTDCHPTIPPRPPTVGRPRYAPFGKMRRPDHRECPAPPPPNTSPPLLSTPKATPRERLASGKRAAPPVARTSPSSRALASESVAREEVAAPGEATRPKEQWNPPCPRNCTRRPNRDLRPFWRRGCHEHTTPHVMPPKTSPLT